MLSIVSVSTWPYSGGWSPLTLYVNEGQEGARYQGLGMSLR